MKLYTRSVKFLPAVKNRNARQYKVAESACFYIYQAFLFFLCLRHGFLVKVKRVLAQVRCVSEQSLKLCKENFKILTETNLAVHNKDGVAESPVCKQKHTE